jgi:FSR family fosmidomycin resistance protein-like MFS transporter
VSSELDRRGLGLLGGAHLSVDLCQAAVPALLPFFVDQRGYSYAAAGALVFAATVGSSLFQPLFGHAADRLQLPWLMPAGVMAAGAGIALSGVTTSYALTFAAIVLSGIGVAAFHPEGARHANYASGVAKARGMSLFALGGNAGFALGPVLTTGCVLALGLSGTLVLGLIPISAGAILAAKRARLHGLRVRGVAAAKAASHTARRDQWGAFARLTGVISLRSCVHFGLLSFVPVWFVTTLDTSEAAGNVALTAMLASGAAGTVVGGRVADRLGRRTILLASLALAGPALAAFIEAPTGPAFVLIAVVGFTVVGTFAITVVLGQEYLPNRLGMASGVTLGAAIGVGGALAPALGALADAHGIETAMWVIAAIPVPAVLLALTLPVDRALGLAPQVPKTRSPASPSPGRM